VMEWNQLWRFRSPHHCGPRVRHADFRTKATLDQRFASVLSIPKFETWLRKMRRTSESGH
jgi:hypothetical protein